MTDVPLAGTGGAAVKPAPHGDDGHVATEDAQGDDRLITGARTPGEVTRDVCGPIERGPTNLWRMAFAVAVAALGIGTYFTI